MADQQRTVQPYRGEREPLKVNAFEALAGSCTPLLPLFPYTGPDAIVPTVAGFSPGPDRLAGRFWHQNSVTEIVTCIGKAGPGGMPPGTVTVNGATHPVGPDKHDLEPDDGTAMVITISQRHGYEEQRETFVLRCSECKHQLLSHEYGFVPHPPEGGEIERFVTIVECANGAERFNEDEALRTCDKCGHVNDPFPLVGWGWRRYRSNLEAAEAARRGLADVSIGGRPAAVAAERVNGSVPA